MNKPTYVQPHAASRARRLGALFYDFIIALGLIMVATYLAIHLFNHSQPIRPNQRWFLPYLLGVLYAYFAFSWSYRGQTIGMRSWKLHIVNEMGAEPSFFQASFRFMFAIPAIAFALPSFGWTLGWLNRRTNTWLTNTPQ